MAHSLVNIDGDENDQDSYKILGDIDYKTFLDRLPQAMCQKLEGHYMLVTISDEKTMLDILNTSKKSTHGFLGKFKRSLGM